MGIIDTLIRFSRKTSKWMGPTRVGAIWKNLSNYWHSVCHVVVAPFNGCFVVFQFYFK